MHAFSLPTSSIESHGHFFIPRIILRVSLNFFMVMRSIGKFAVLFANTASGYMYWRISRKIKPWTLRSDFISTRIHSVYAMIADAMLLVRRTPARTKSILDAAEFACCCSALKKRRESSAET